VQPKPHPAKAEAKKDAKGKKVKDTAAAKSRVKSKK
jgi:hypothetical protein